jgi:hypothetical protein
LIWEAIKQACDTGLTSLDFGRCSPENEGLRVFKQRWTADEADLPYYFYPEISGVSTGMGESLKYKAMNIVTCCLPQRISTAVGSLLYKHLG